MKLDPGMHIGLHLVFFGKTGVTVSELVLVFIDSNQSKIQGWRTRNRVRVLHTSMARTTRCGVNGWRRFSTERVRCFGMSRWTQAMSRIEGHVRRQ
jgi:hypothetical protein